MKMILNYVGGKKSECVVLNETKRYIVFRATATTMKYRLDKITMEVQDGTYHNVIKGLTVDICK